MQVEWRFHAAQARCNATARRQSDAVRSVKRQSYAAPQAITSAITSTSIAFPTVSTIFITSATQSEAAKVVEWLDQPT